MIRRHSATNGRNVFKPQYVLLPCFQRLRIPAARVNDGTLTFFRGKARQGKRTEPLSYRPHSDVTKYNINVNRSSVCFCFVFLNQTIKKSLIVVLYIQSV